MRKIAVMFWSSVAVLTVGVLCATFSLPGALIVGGTAGVVASAAWFIDHIRSQP